MKITNNKGITLVALVVTIIILIILAGISLNALVGKDGLISRTRGAAGDYAVADTEEAQKRANLAEYVKGKTNGSGGGTQNSNIGNLDTYNFEIDVNVSNYNETLQSFPVAFNVVATKDGTTLYDDLVIESITSEGITKINFPVAATEGAVVQINNVYSGANYNIDSNTKSVTLSNEKNLKTTFTVGYNNKNIVNSYIALSN